MRASCMILPAAAAGACISTCLSDDMWSRVSAGDDGV